MRALATENIKDSAPANDGFFEVLIHFSTNVYEGREYVISDRVALVLVTKIVAQNF